MFFKFLNLIFNISLVDFYILFYIVHIFRFVFLSPIRHFCCFKYSITLEFFFLKILELGKICFLISIEFILKIYSLFIKGRQTITADFNYILRMKCLKRLFIQHKQATCLQILYEKLYRFWLISILKCLTSRSFVLPKQLFRLYFHLKQIIDFILFIKAILKRTNLDSVREWFLKQNNWKKMILFYLI